MHNRWRGRENIILKRGLSPTANSCGDPYSSPLRKIEILYCKTESESWGYREVNINRVQ
jgi:hypothetical protein